MSQNYKSEEVDKTVEPEEVEDENSSVDGDDELPRADAEEESSSSDEVENDVRHLLKLYLIELIYSRSV